MTVAERIYVMIEEQSGVTVGPGTPVSDLQLDSLEYLSLIVQIETEFDCGEIPKRVIAMFQTAGDIAAWVKEHWGCA